MRAEIDRAILDEEAALAAVVALLTRRAPWAAWPRELRSALALALEPASLPAPEAARARALLRHLVGADAVDRAWPPAPAPTSPTTRRRAERLRADLPACVALRAGRHLLDG